MRSILRSLVHLFSTTSRSCDWYENRTLSLFHRPQSKPPQYFRSSRPSSCPPQRRPRDRSWVRHPTASAPLPRSGARRPPTARRCSWKPLPVSGCSNGSCGKLPLRSHLKAPKAEELQQSLTVHPRRLSGDSVVRSPWRNKRFTEGWQAEKSSESCDHSRLPLTLHLPRPDCTGEAASPPPDGGWSLTALAQPEACLKRTLLQLRAFLSAHPGQYDLAETSPVL